jgi:hypothetical protein
VEIFTVAGTLRLLEQASDLGAVDGQVSFFASYHYVKLEIVGSKSVLLRRAEANCMNSVSGKWRSICQDDVYPSFI